VEWSSTQECNPNTVYDKQNGVWQPVLLAPSMMQPPGVLPDHAAVQVEQQDMCRMSKWITNTTDGA
jgi:hypothetical protein